MNTYHTPLRDAPRHRWTQPEWSTVAAFTGFVLVIVLAAGLYHALVQNDRLVSQALLSSEENRELAETNNRLQSRIQEVQTTAARERSSLLAQQETLLTLVASRMDNPIAVPTDCRILASSLPC